MSKIGGEAGGWEPQKNRGQEAGEERVGSGSSMKAGIIYLKALKSFQKQEPKCFLTYI